MRREWKLKVLKAIYPFCQSEKNVLTYIHFGDCSLQFKSSINNNNIHKKMYINIQPLSTFRFEQFFFLLVFIILPFLHNVIWSNVLRTSKELKIYYLYIYLYTKPTNEPHFSSNGIRQRDIEQWKIHWTDKFTIIWICMCMYERIEIYVEI